MAFVCQEPSATAPRQLCGVGFDRRADMTKHAWQYHPQQFPHACRLCEARWRFPSGLKQHMRTHEAKLNRKCVCQLPQSDDINVLRQSQQHGEQQQQQQQQLQVCGLEFASRSLLRQHREAAHSNYMGVARSLKRQEVLSQIEAEQGIASRTCDKCSVVFKNAHSLRTHMRRSACNTDRPSFLCNADGCAKAFVTMHGLRLHVKTIHEGKRARFVCPIGSCGEPFLRKVLLTRHLRTHGTRMEQLGSSLDSLSIDGLADTSEGVDMHANANSCNSNNGKEDREDGVPSSPMSSAEGSQGQLTAEELQAIRTAMAPTQTRARTKHVPAGGYRPSHYEKMQRQERRRKATERDAAKDEDDGSAPQLKRARASRSTRRSLNSIQRIDEDDIIASITGLS